jgi:hypothetical protein
MISRIKKAFRIAARGIIGSIVLVVMMGFSGCIFWPVSEKELIGIYQSVSQDGSPGLPDGGSEILELKMDGTCKQDIALKDGRKFSAQGTWKYNTSGTINLRGLHLTVGMDEKINPEI